MRGWLIDVALRTFLGSLQRRRRGGRSFLVSGVLTFAAAALFAGAALASADGGAKGGSPYYAVGVDPQFGVCRGTDPSCYHRWFDFDPARNVSFVERSSVRHFIDLLRSPPGVGLLDGPRLSSQRRTEAVRPLEVSRLVARRTLLSS